MAYSDIQTSVSGLLNRRDATTSQVQSWIQMAIVRIQRELRVPAMEKSSQITIAAGYTGMPIPTDFLELIDLIPISDTYDQIRLEKKDLTRALQASAITGFPEIYARQGNQWIIGPSPGVGDIIQINYYAEFGALVNPTDSNILTTVMSDLVIYGALSFAGDFFVDKRIQGWEARYTQILNQLNMMAQDDDDQGAATVVPAYSIPDEYCYTGPWNWIP